MPSKSKKQKRFMAAAAHNKKFAKKAGIKQSVAREFHEADRRSSRVRKAAGGSVRDPLRTGPRSGSGALGSLGKTAKLGGLGDSGRPRSGFGALAGRSVRPAGSALSGGPLPVSRGTSNLRPRPGRGVDPVLATAGTTFHEAKDRLDSLRARLR